MNSEPMQSLQDRSQQQQFKSARFDMLKSTLKRVGDHQELANLAAYLVSDFSAYVNGEVVVIDGGEWLKGAGQFNLLEAIRRAMGSIRNDDKG
jgi:NAD(P)-dependent dehydrogenase (short-subunit alcohol dehydrogenase family)